MTQPYVPPWIAYAGDGVQTTFSYPWRLLASSHLEVYVGGSLSTAYTLTGVGAATGGTVVFYVPPVGTVFLRRVTARTQETDFRDGDAFSAAAPETALDKMTLMIQDLLEELSRRPALPIATATTLRDLLMPTPVPSKLWGWSADGLSVTLYDPTIQQVTVNPASGEAHGISTATVSSSGGANVLTASALIPAGVLCKGLGYRVLTAFSTENGLTSVDLGGMGRVNRWGTALALTLGSTNTEGQMRGDEPRTLSAEDVFLLPNGGAFGATGQAKLTAFWRTLTPAS